MSAPEVGDRVRVIAGQWVGWEGIVLDRLNSTYVWVSLTSTDPAHRDDPLTFTRCLHADEVEVVPTTRTQPPQGHVDGSGAPVEEPTADGATEGVER